MTPPEAEATRWAQLVRVSGLAPMAFLRLAHVRCMLRGWPFEAGYVLQAAELVALTARFPHWPGYLYMPCCATAEVVDCPGCGGKALCEVHGDRCLGKSHE